MSAAEAYAALGRKFRDIRLEKKIALETASRVLYIRARYLQALEDGLLEELPGAAYVKGYIYHYSNYLGLPAGEMVENFEKIGALPTRRFFYIPDSISRAQHPRSDLVFSTLGIAAAIAFLWAVTVPTPGVRRTQLVAPPPLPLSLQHAALAKDCLKQSTAFWPPCYWQEVTKIVFLPQKPVASVMELSHAGYATTP